MTKRSISVLHLAPTMSPDDGISLAVVTILETLARQGLNASLLAGKRADVPLNPILEENRIRVHTFRVQSVFGKWIANAIWPLEFSRVLAEISRTADVVHIHGMWLYPTIVGCPILRRLKVPYVISPHGSLMDEALRRNRIKKLTALQFFERANVTSAAAVVVTSDAELDQLRALDFHGRAAVVPLAVAPAALEFFSSRRFSDEYLARRARTILCVSRFHPRKRLVELVNLFAQLASDHPLWRLRIAGPDSELGYRDKVIAAAAASTVDERITVEPALHDEALWRAYLDADLFVLPSTFENFGLVVSEALAAGVPAITSRGAPWPQLERDKCGWWIDGSLSSLRSTLAEAMSTPPVELFAMGRRGAKTIFNDFSIDALGRRLADVYTSILE